jgi:hypothetical protein
MAWKPKPMKIQCHQCKKIGIFAPKSDVILGFPRCKMWNGNESCRKSDIIRLGDISTNLYT